MQKSNSTTIAERAKSMLGWLLGSLTTKKEGESYDELSSEVRSAFYDLYGLMNAYVPDVFPAYAIVCKDGEEYFKVNYSKDANGGITFDNIDNWQSVERQWVVTSSKEAAKPGAASLDLESDKNTFTITRKEEGAPLRWTLFSSSAYKDKDRQIVSKEAQEADCDYMNETGDFGVLRFWHLGEPHPTTGDYRSYKAGPGVDLGICDFSAMEGNIRIESGTFYDEAIGLAMKEHAAELGASIYFSHPLAEPDASGVFSRIHTFERSLLPNVAMSNYLAAVPIIAKEHTNMDEVKKAKLIELIGAEAAQHVIDRAQADDATAKAAGMVAKEVGGGDPAKPNDGLSIEALTAVMTTVMAPFVERLIGVEAKLGDVATAKEAQTTLAEQIAATAKAQTTTLEAVTALQTSMNASEKKLKELLGDRPKSLQHRPSTADDNIVSKETAAEHIPGNGTPSQNAQNYPLDGSFMDFVTTGKQAHPTA